MKTLIRGIIKTFHDVTFDRHIQANVESITTKPVRVSPFYPEGDGAMTFETQFLAA